MESPNSIEQACKENNHAYVKQCLDAMESDDIKREAFLNIINYYENELAQFPVGYVVLFIEWLLKSRDFDEAGKYIEKLSGMDIVKERISEHIYEYVIKPDEPEYEKRFNRNLAILKENGVLFSKQAFDFQSIRKKITTIRKLQSHSEENNMPELHKTSFLFVDLIDMKLIQRILGAGNLLYLIYDDIRKFYYMLLFEDMLSIKKNIEANASDEMDNVIFFAGRDKDCISEFFDSRLTRTPEYVVVLPEHNEYQGLMDKIRGQREEGFLAAKKKIKAYCKNRGHKYYQNLFSKNPEHIKILMVTTRGSTLNKHISKSWHSAFTALGYTVKLLIENEHYERIQNSYIAEIMCSFRPDMVFHINVAVNSIFDEKEIKNSLLWIMRYRDYNEISFGDFEYQGENMFYLPLFPDLTSALRKTNVPENRIYHSVEGVDINLFSKAGEIDEKYACDIVSVNNAVGSDLFRLNRMVEKIEVDELKEIMREVYTLVQEMAMNDEFMSEKEFMILIYDKNRSRGFEVNEQGRKFFEVFYQYIINAFYRRRVIDWIIDSNITENIKVWGSSWSNIDKFKKYHMGTAEYGKELSGIYGSSKISLCDTWGWNTHERNYEILASGGFPLVRSVTAEENERMGSISNYFIEDEEIVLFDDKDDLLNKVQYYLDHPEERERIAENGRNVVINNLSNMAIAGNTMDFISNYYSKRGRVRGK